MLIISPKRFTGKPSKMGAQLIRNHPHASGLVGCWLFNEGAGVRINDLAGNDFVSQITSDVSWKYSYGTYGLSGSVLDSSGTGINRCRLGSVITVATTFSFDCLVQVRTDPTGGIPLLMDNGGSNGPLIFTSSGEKLGLAIGGSIPVSGSIALGTTWHHLAVTRDAGNTARLFVDGILDNSGAAAGSLSLENFFDDTSADRLDGQCMFVRLWNTYIPPTGIKELADPSTMFAMLQPQAPQRRIWVAPAAGPTIGELLASTNQSPMPTFNPWGLLLH